MDPSRPLTVNDLDTPAVLVEQRVMRENIQRMQRLADDHCLALRPHVKTHKSVYLAQQQLAAGAAGIAVAKLSEAEVFAHSDVRDIQIANQVIGRRKVERLADLAQKVTISSAVDSPEPILEIAEVFASRGLTANLLIEMDTGLHRSGVAAVQQALALAELIDSHKGVSLLGVMTHAGHAYGADSDAKLEQIGWQEGETMVRVASELRRHGFPVNVVSVGSTPTARFAAQIAGITELRVGNYIFNDMIQVGLGVASLAECALSVLTTVISVHDGRLVIDAGSKVLSSDTGAHGANIVSGYGFVTGKNLLINRLSEEHGIIQTAQPTYLKVGDRLRIIPNHACPVANLAERIYLVDQDYVVMELPVEARGKVS